MSKVIVVGAGAAGMIAAIMAARAGHKVCLYEKNDRLGRKLFITGKGRCNVTNACDTEVLFQNVISNPKFLYSAFYGFTNEDIQLFFEELGCKLKIERGDRIFPVSDHSSDIIKALQQELNRLQVKIFLNEAVKQLEIQEGQIQGVRLQNGTIIVAPQVIVATGGISYPLTGSTGDGHRMAKKVGHIVTDLSPALVPLVIEEECCKQLQGLSLKNVGAAIQVDDGKQKEKMKLLYEGFGEMLFTHYGVSGPLILSGSSYFVKGSKEKKGTLTLDLKPALTLEQLDKRILRDFEESQNKQFKNAVNHLFPAKLIPVMIALSKIDPSKQVNEITREERRYFAQLIKNWKLTITGTGDVREAIITQGGISVKEINPATMESKKIKGLYFAGELLDVDALTGGFNLQIAWSTGYLAGSSLYNYDE